MKNVFLRKISWPLFIPLITLLFTACDDDDDVVDVESPQIEIENPAFGEKFAAGSSVHFEAVFTDNENLASYEIDIHNNFDGHSHGRLDNLFKWSFKESYEVSGKMYEAHLHDEIQIDADAMAGPYHFIVKALDASGNATSFQDGSNVEVEILITNETQAKVVLEMEAGHDELDGHAGEAMHLHGEITDLATGDAPGIVEVIFTLGDEEEHGHDHDHGRLTEEEIVVDFDFENPVMSIDIEELLESAPDDKKLIVPADATDGEHKQLTIRVEDAQGNITIERFEVHIHDD